jgi:hypothetical protein
LREFYDRRIVDFLICCGFNLVGWVAGCFEVYWVSFGLLVLLHHHALGWLRERAAAGART